MIKYFPLKVMKQMKNITLLQAMIKSSFYCKKASLENKPWHVFVFSISQTNMSLSYPFLPFFGSHLTMKTNINSFFVTIVLEKSAFLSLKFFFHLHSRTRKTIKLLMNRVVGNYFGGSTFEDNL